MQDEFDEEEMLEDDEITPAEAAFLEGYERGEMVECENCGKEIEKDSAVKKKIDGEKRLFCSEECAEDFIESQAEI